MKKKFVSALLIAAMTMTALAGCGGGESTETKAATETTAEATSEDAVKIGVI